MRGLYQHLKRSVGLSGRQAGGQQPVADENGVLLWSKNDILQRWARFFGTLLNTKSPTLNPDIIEQVMQRPATCAIRRLGAVPDPEEVERATKGLQNWKAPGNDSLPAELLKIDDDDEESIVMEDLRAIFVKTWNGGEIPQEWKDTTIKVLYKKGDRFNCNNFRGISLLSHVDKAPVKIITNRLSALCETNNIVPEEQCTFRPGRSTIDMLEDGVFLQNLVYLKEETGAGAGTPLDQVRRAVLGILHADDAGVVPRSADGLARMMIVIVEVSREFGLTVSEKKAKTLLMRLKQTVPPLPPPPPLIIEAAGQTYAQTAESGT
ncbi:unnamed protein product [Ectocarpus sp. CCAP 1310/34]|nr:unnamed protein product [Ectocarpus sp. CCAP 1310/34]